ncbi:phosphagen kinase active site signature [Lucifera butyrica]|uniref:Protein-arginine kinase n=1 Tax=Lucifera butyrica TaxID=1351585 RepID=A0A498RBY1_9FIRM|nr:protein arginine kinase [Lucifera butyrica]VBB08495.1 phosphagen kinase active site signature [Lucifera butyrica]
MSLENLLDQPLNSWMAGGGEEGDIVLSSRIRLARNMESTPFPNRANQLQLRSVVDESRLTLNRLNSMDNHKYLFIELEKLTPLERNVLVEKHIISPNHAQEPEQRALIARDDATVIIMINEEDHLRIQCMMPGLNLLAAAELASQIDDILEERCTLAFTEQMGYLTSCPTNLGTGLRASVMVHLPALVLTRQISRIVGAATQLGLAVRGLYGEGTEAVGNIFQISNQLTLGYSEQEIIANLSSVVKQVVDQERAARTALMTDSKDALSDRVWRAFGVLRYARSISGQEALSMLSEVRLGIDLKIIDEVPGVVFNELLVITRPNYLQKMAGREELEPGPRDRLRAQIIREKLKGGKSSC